MSRKAKPWFDKHNGKWYTTDEGKRVLLSDGPKNATTEKLAYEVFYQFMSEKTQREEVAPTPSRTTTSVFSFFNSYLRWFEKSGVKVRTYKRTKYYLEEFAHSFGKRMLNSLIPLDLSKWVQEQSEDRWKSTDSQATVIRSIKAAFSWGVKQGVLSKNPFASVPLSFRVKRKPASEQEFATVVSLFPDKPRVQEFLTFLFLTGCRPSEVRSIEWNFIDLEAGVIRIPIHKTSKQLATPKPRQVLLTEDAVKLLVDIRKREDHSELVFVNHRKQPYSEGSIQQYVRHRTRKVGVDFVFHSYGLRHCYGTSAIKKGVSLAVLAELMGHASVKTTEHYLHLSGEVELLRRAAEQVRGKS